MTDLHLLLRSHASFKRALNTRLMSELGLSVSQGSALVHLSRKGRASCQELAKLMGCGSSRISRLTLDLEKQHLLQSCRDSEDRRVVKLALTSEGSELAARVPNVFRDAECQFLNRLSCEEVRSLQAFLSKITRNLEDISGCR